MQAGELATIGLVRRLEDDRYAAMAAGDARALDLLLSDRLVYTHSAGQRDTKETYLAKVRDRTFVYDSIDHPEDRILVGAGCAVVIGTMIARGWWADRPVQLRNAATAVWATEDGTMRLLAYAPTPLAGQAR